MSFKSETFSISVEGKKFVSVIHHPIQKGGKVLLFCHGFPGTNRLPHLRESLAKPFSLVEINYRGDKASEGHFSFLGCGEDILTVAQHLQKQYGSLVYALGYSAGGLYVLNVARQYPILFQGILLANPLVDAEFLVSSSLMKELWLYAKDMLTLRSSDFYQKETKKMHEKHNPMDFAAEITTPIWFLQALKDEVLPAKTAQNFFSKLKCQKQWSSIPNGKHDLFGNERELLQIIAQL